MPKYIAHIPEIDPEKHLQKLGDLDLKIVALAVNNPISTIELCKLLKIDLEVISKRVAALQNIGWLANIDYYVGSESFTTDEFTYLGEDKKLKQEYSKRTKIKPKSKNKFGEYE